MRNVRRKAFLVVLLPVLVMTAWVTKLTYDRETGLKITLPIRGYDPRDLLSGNYVRFQVDYGNYGCPKENADWHRKFCVCVRADETAPITGSGYCDVKPASCEYFIEGYCRYSSLGDGIERYYISERLSREGVTLGKEARVKLSVPKSGRALVLGLIF